jgi:periplasmic nitrate reductase NapE
MDPRTPMPGELAPDPHRKKRELRVLAFILIVLFPVLTIMVIGGIGLTVWIWQTFTTPPFPG